jgi:hypothetical protein
MSRWIRIIAAAEAVAVVGTMLLAFDIYAHKRVEELGGVNIWGYRGAVAAQRQPDEIRIVVVGGTRAFGWGQPGSALGSQIRRLIMLAIDRPGARLQPVTVINLGRLGALAGSYPATLDRYGYLQPDIICIYDDLGVRGAEPSDGMSGVFELTGYAPILPLVLREKGTALKLTSGFGPRRLAGSVLAATGSGLAAVDRAAARVLARPPAASAPYADAMMAAIDAAHRHARSVLVAVSVAETAEQVENRRALMARLPSVPGAAEWLRYVDLGTDPRLHGDRLRLDGWNYGGDGTTIVAEAMTPAFLSLMARP